MDLTNTHRDLVERCKAGRREAQFELYRLYSRAMYNTANRMVGNPLDAEDLLQSTFIEVFTKLDTFRYESTIGAWIKRITVNKCINFLKSRRLVFKEMNELPDKPDDSDSDAPVNPKYTVQKINSAIERLPDGYRVVFNLYALEGYDHEEIGQILDISEATSKSQYSRAKAKLRDMLG